VWARARAPHPRGTVRKALDALPRRERWRLTQQWLNAAGIAPGVLALLPAATGFPPQRAAGLPTRVRRPPLLRIATRRRQ